MFCVIIGNNKVTLILENYMDIVSILILAPNELVSVISWPWSSGAYT